MHDSGLDSFLLDLLKGKCPEALRAELMQKRLGRFIGVIHWPDTERWSHHSSAGLPEQSDGYIWFDDGAVGDAVGDKRDVTFWVAGPVSSWEDWEALRVLYHGSD